MELVFPVFSLAFLCSWVKLHILLNHSAQNTQEHFSFCRHMGLILAQPYHRDTRGIFVKTYPRCQLCSSVLEEFECFFGVFFSQLLSIELVNGSFNASLVSVIKLCRTELVRSLCDLFRVIAQVLHHSLDKRRMLRTFWCMVCVESQSIRH